MDSILSFSFLDKIFVAPNVVVAKIKETKIFLRAEFKDKNNKECIKVIWYYNDSNNPRLVDVYPFVDVLTLVSEEVSEQLIFNMQLFIR